MLRTTILLACMACAAVAAAQEPPPLIDTAAATAIAAEISGEGAKRTVRALSSYHRMRGSEGFRAAAELIRDRLTSYGLKDVEIISLPADGKIFYGTQRARPAWNASFAELWEQRGQGISWVDGEKLASWQDEPITLAQDSVSGSANAELVDVGAGTAQSDYAGKDIRGKFVLISTQPEEAAGLAVTRYGAAGIVSWAQNQKQAWWGEDETLVRWGHLDTWKDPTFAFMVSPARAHDWQGRLRHGDTIRLRAQVKAGRSGGAYLIPTGVIEGRDRAHEIVFSCHLDHPSPGANDNASGCAGVLEVARTLNRLVAAGRLPQPERTLRFIWPCEIECTISLLNARPEFARRTLATIHLDMIGGDTERTKSILRVEGTPPSLPSFVDDVAFAIARWVNSQSLAYADTGSGDWRLYDAQGSKSPLQAVVGGFSEDSDHAVWAEGSWRIPVIYLADWPDRYIHTQRDIPDNLDATKLKRAIFIAGASGWYLANVGPNNLQPLKREMLAASLEHRAELMRKAERVGLTDAAAIERYSLFADAGETGSLASFELSSTKDTAHGYVEVRPLSLVHGIGAPIYRRVEEPKGPMNGMGYSWFEDRTGRKHVARPALLDRDGPRDAPSYAYETLNLVDGTRSVQEIRDFLSATIGPVPIEPVAEYLGALEKIGVIQRLDGRGPIDPHR